ncbi:MAG: hypothetical protein K2N48_05810 [Muribaculaceae bacterium]|nr:hypothetical protein [Muribaculaceae bacterium]
MTEHQINTPPRQENDALTSVSDTRLGSDHDLIKAVSGYGRELFFSNIIDYIANHCSEVIASALQEFLPASGFDKVERENRHMDLVFFGRDANQSIPVLVVENKRGSIATEKQLQEYLKKITRNKGNKIGKNSECSFLLISPHCFDKDVADKAGWSFMGYKDLGQRLDSALKVYAEKNSGYSDTLQYKLLKAAIEYMPFLEEESTRIYDGVKSDTKCSELRNQDDSSDAIKLRYCAVAHMLNVKLKEEGVIGVDCSFDSGSTLPMANVEVKDFLEIGKDKLSFFLSFQGEVLSIGFFQEGHFAKLDNKDKKDSRKKMWRIHNFAEILKQITDRPEGFDDYKGTGYMTSGYILPMYRIDMRDKTVYEILETMCRYAKGALAYKKNIRTNP